MRLTSASDIAALERQGFSAVYPARTPHDMIAASAARAPDAPAIRFLRDADDPSRDICLSYAGLLDHIHAAANLFRDMGVGPEDAVAILAPHTPSAQIALWAAELAGRACPINLMLRPDHIAGLFAAAGVKLAVVIGVNSEQDIWAPLVDGLRTEGVTIPILACDADASCPGADGLFEELVAARLGVLLGFAIAGDEHSLAAFYHTGGTTGAPKLVRHSRLNQAHVARSCALMHDLGPDDVVLNGFPLFHVAGAFVYGLSTLSAGGMLLIPGRLGMRNRAFTGAIWRQVERHRITTLGVVPTVMSAFNGVAVDADISSLRKVLTGGSPLPPELADAFERKTGAPVRNILGMTECAGTIAVEPVHAPRTPNAAGFPLPFTRVAIFAAGPGDTDTTRPLAPGETGVIALRGPNVAGGYSDPARNAGTFTPDGWLISGDLGHIDAEGRLYVTGRQKDIIIRGGHNIDPQSIEDALLAHGDVRDAAAVGMPDAYAGELPVAFVALHPGAAVDAAGLLEFLRARIEEPAALPKRIEIVEALPLTPIGKIFKPALRRIACDWALRAALADCGIDPAACRLTIDESLRVDLAAPAAALDRLRAALAGMPLDLRLTALPRGDAT